ncbi:hypothetical protein COEREDRAFT_82937 [Coemansia reversa NRRL 1564]|uniref:Myb-like domain-containing protein n=1 Tax=Coemansia reversa (strain ATCC 12441 / NRRL 1564) TaxID=763665 RepID=A0A2G5B526_COERN|nr:hypothetical protein COEREDRAFT_82937 [Coemansia reversa NRRL 1564]|eukprot:PIA14109.1 hypothetical protein COEREDRAFT_82937 [Coemansia reversa NRRL 1564]
MLQCRGLRFSQNCLALYGGAPARLLNAQTAWRFSRLYASATKDTTSDQQQRLIYEIRTYQKENVTIPWYMLAAQYRMTIDSIKQILGQDDTRIREQKELSVRVTQRAEQLYDKDRGRCDWEAVANEFEKPLMQCLALYDAALSTIVARSRPNITDWPVEDVEVIKSFVAKHLDSITSDNLRLASIYMNVTHDDCISINFLFGRPKMTADLHEAIKQCREDGMRWKDIHVKYPFWRSWQTLCFSYTRFGRKLPHKAARDVQIKWTKSETTRIQEILKEHYKPGNIRLAIQVATAEFAYKPKIKVKGKIIRTHKKLYLKPSKQNEAKMRRLVETHGEDWIRIGAEMRITTNQAQKLWKKCAQLHSATSAWTEDEVEILRKCIKNGIGPAEASRLVGTKRICNCANMMNTLRKSEQTGRLNVHGRQWSSVDKTRLMVLVSAFDHKAVDWAHISKELGREIKACKSQHVILNRENNNRLLRYTDATNAEARRQYEQRSGIDWAQVSQTVGLSERECLEICQFDVGKTRWTYDPDTFSWDTANKMTGFIKANYPPPTPVNYRAVSNYMWVDINDCAYMAMLLRGEVEWTDKIIARVAKLRSQGMKFKDISKQISPNLLAKRVGNVYHNNILQKLYSPISDEDKQFIKRLLDEHAETMPYEKLAAFIAGRFTSENKHPNMSRISLYAMCHPVYKARLEKAGKTNVMNQLSAGTTSVKKLAEELDLPSVLLRNLHRKAKKRTYPIKWTHDETEQLILYVQSNTLPYNWKLFSAQLGTKNGRQSYFKWLQLKKKGQL